MLSEPTVTGLTARQVSAIAVASWPVAGETVTVGPSARAFTVTDRLAVVDVAVVPPVASVAVAVSFRVPYRTLFRSGVRVRPLSCAGVRVHVPLPSLVPADSVAPVGTLLTVIAVML